jgi:pimeloyl-ACP methyl ester carboxylesterase
MPRLVLLPGFDGTGDLFEPFVDALPAGVAVTVVRYGASVTSYAQCLDIARQHLPPAEPYILLGESFSGPVAISIAATDPPGLRGVVLAGSFMSSPSRMLTWLSPLIGLMPTHGAPEWITDFLLLGRFATPAWRKRVADAMAHISPTIARMRLREIALTSASDDLKRIGVPLLYLRGTRDRLVRGACAEQIVRLLPHAQIVDIDAPHLMLQCAPRESVAALLNFVRQTGALRRGCCALRAPARHTDR